jgi:hypothetical protein
LDGIWANDFSLRIEKNLLTLGFSSLLLTRRGSSYCPQLCAQPCFCFPWDAPLQKHLLASCRHHEIKCVIAQMRRCSPNAIAIRTPSAQRLDVGKVFFVFPAQRNNFFFQV